MMPEVDIGGEINVPACFVMGGTCPTPGKKVFGAIWRDLVGVAFTGMAEVDSFHAAAASRARRRLVSIMADGTTVEIENQEALSPLPRN